jgi:hypothetical protein
MPPAPFRVMDAALAILSVGRSAQSLRELRDHLGVVPAGSLWHHLGDVILRPSLENPELRNDFARWAHRRLGDDTLAERLAVIDVGDFNDGERLRQALLDIVDDRLAEVASVPMAPVGHEFHFMTSQTIIFDTGLTAADPRALGRLIPSLSTGSIFFHFVEARRRPAPGVDDFSHWLSGWGDQGELLMGKLASVDLHRWSLIEMRDRIAACFQKVGERDA